VPLILGALYQTNKIKKDWHRVFRIFTYFLPNKLIIVVVLFAPNAPNEDVHPAVFVIYGNIALLYNFFLGECVTRWQWPYSNTESLFPLIPVPPAMPADDAEKSVPGSNAVEKKDDDKDKDTPESRTLYPILRRVGRRHMGTSSSPCHIE
jgi:hypothetical protein